MFNAVAYTAVDDAEEHADEAYAVNKSFPALLGRIVRGSSVRLIHYGTDFVFNGKKRTPYVEDEPHRSPVGIRSQQTGRRASFAERRPG